MLQRIRAFTMTLMVGQQLLRATFAFPYTARRHTSCRRISFEARLSQLYEPNSCQGTGVRVLFRRALVAAASSSSSADSLITLEDGVHVDEQTIKKSRFIGLAKNCDSWDEAQAFVASVRAEHPKARHVCFGFVAGQNPVQERASDDGEPTGTAGAPILGAIKGEGLSDIVCAVVRYSGGIKLGAGGLIRAYGGTARLALRVGPTKVLIPKSSVRVSTAAQYAGCIYDAARKFNGVASGETYNDRGNIEVTLICENKYMEEMKEDLRDATRGDAVFLE